MDVTSRQFRVHSFLVLERSAKQSCFHPVLAGIACFESGFLGGNL
jgi:hypothetical protein